MFIKFAKAFGHCKTNKLLDLVTNFIKIKIFYTFSVAPSIANEYSRLF